MDFYILESGCVVFRGVELPEFFVHLDTRQYRHMNKYVIGRCKIFGLICKHFIPYIISYDQMIPVYEIVNGFITRVWMLNGKKYSKHTIGTDLYCKLLCQKNYGAAKNLLRDFVKYGILYDFSYAAELAECDDRELILNVIRVYGSKRAYKYRKSIASFAINFGFYEIFDILMYEFGIRAKIILAIIEKSIEQWREYVTGTTIQLYENAKIFVLSKIS